MVDDYPDDQTTPPGSYTHDDDRKSEPLCECVGVEEKTVGSEGSTATDNESFELIHLCVSYLEGSRRTDKMRDSKFGDEAV